MSSQEYISSLPAERQEAVQALRDAFAKKLPKGFSESGGPTGIHFAVPHSIYPNGYHVNPKQPLPFVSIISQKNFVAVYHMGLYADPETLSWFQQEYASRVPTKLDMGKSCIRLKKTDQIPVGLFEELAQKFTTERWIGLYESAINVR